MALVENIQRSDLNPVEIAISYHRLIDECNITHQELSSKVGKERSTISNYVRLLKLPPSIQSALKNKIISMGHARCLAGIEHNTDQLNIFKEIVSRGLSVRDTEKLIKNAKPGNNNRTSSNKKKGLTPEVLKIQDGLSNLLETRVKISRNEKGKGHISIPFSSDKSFNNLLEQLGYL
jgi:ParB family chromosome partitioning protein